MTVRVAFGNCPILQLLERPALKDGSFWCVWRADTREPARGGCLISLFCDVGFVPAFLLYCMCCLFTCLLSCARSQLRLEGSLSSSGREGPSAPRAGLPPSRAHSGTRRVGAPAPPGPHSGSRPRERGAQPLDHQEAPVSVFFQKLLLVQLKPYGTIILNAGFASQLWFILSQHTHMCVSHST